MEPHGQDPLIVDCYLSPARSTSSHHDLILEINAIDRPMRIARDEAMLTQQEHAQSLLRGLAQ